MCWSRALASIEGELYSPPKGLLENAMSATRSEAWRSNRRREWMPKEDNRRIVEEGDWTQINHRRH